MKSPLMRIAICVAAGAVIGSVCTVLALSPKTDSCASRYTLLNPEPDCDTYDDRSSKLEELQSVLELQVSRFESRDDISRVAIFVRDLKTRRFAGVNDDQVFDMASLLKVPVLIAYYKYADIDPAILTDTALYDGSLDDGSIQDIPVKDPLVRGKSYTISDLLYRSIVYSDNAATRILLSRLPDEFMTKMLSTLGLQIETPEGNKELLITAKAYTGVFRGLYNASFLSRDMSQKALELLTKTDFANGARVALPIDVTIAEKFGERTNVNTSGAVVSRQLLDCGIVYARGGKNPYTFCVMTQGNDFSTLEKAVQEISSTIYSHIGN